MRINPAYKKIIEETMERYGIQDHRLEMGGKHAHLLFSHDAVRTRSPYRAVRLIRSAA